MRNMTNLFVVLVQLLAMYDDCVKKRDDDCVKTLYDDCDRIRTMDVDCVKKMDVDCVKKMDDDCVKETLGFVPVVQYRVDVDMKDGQDVEKQSVSDHDCARVASEDNLM